MKNLEKLVTGYKKFQKKNFKHYEERYRHLAKEGQSPKIMVIGCCDSRVNPDFIFNAAPGDLFIVRNVANLVPPYEPDDAHHSTSAALEFAVKSLKIEHIVVMGHSQCGGIKACCEQAHNNEIKGEFISQWLSVLKNCAENVFLQNPHLSSEELSQMIEHQAIIESLKNLKSFPFIKKNLDNHSLQIHGAYFNIHNAQLYALNKEQEIFIPVE